MNNDVKERYARLRLQNTGDEECGGKMDGFLAPKETLTRKRVEEILHEKDYSYFEQKVTLLEFREESLVLKISFLVKYKNRMIVIEEKEPIVLSFSDFKVEDWGDGIKKIADVA